MHVLKDFNFILFGATGDLAMRKIFPCLFQTYSNKLLHPHGKIIAASRSSLDRSEFLQRLNMYSKIYIKDCNENLWENFVKNIDYLALDIQNTHDFLKLKKIMKQTSNTIIYFSIAPEHFIECCKNLALVGLNASTKIVLEKPLGRDLESCEEINEIVGEFFKEEQIYRIDHYLGKESVQNILALRFANSLFAGFWNAQFIHHVQITVFEELGVEGRGEFYDNIGALRDMLQNHMMQILCFVAMEMPKSLDAQEIRNQKLKLLRSLKPLDSSQIAKNVVRAQYRGNDELKGYLQEDSIPSQSQTETYVALRLEIENERWKGVPFYLRTGKRMASQYAEVLICFKDQMGGLFGLDQNQLIIALQPQNSITLQFQVKQMGKDFHLATKELQFDFANHQAQAMEAYAKLILDVIDGNPRSFNRRDELEEAWRWVMPILTSWEANDVPLFFYEAGSLGPKEADEIVSQDGNFWINWLDDE